MTRHVDSRSGAAPSLQGRRRIIVPCIAAAALALVFPRSLSSRLVMVRVRVPGGGGGDRRPLLLLLLREVHHPCPQPEGPQQGHALCRPTHMHALATTVHTHNPNTNTCSAAPVAPIHLPEPCNEWPKCLAPYETTACEWRRVADRETVTSTSNPAAQARSIHCCSSLTLGTRPLPSNITALGWKGWKERFE